jgi:hypothetical protein
MDVNAAVPYAVDQRVEIPAMPLRSTNGPKESLVNIILGIPTCAIQHEFSHGRMLHRLGDRSLLLVYRL